MTCGTPEISETLRPVWKTCYLLCRAQVLTCGAIYLISFKYLIDLGHYKKKKKRLLINIPLSLINCADSSLETQQSAIRLCMLAFSNLVLPVHSQMFVKMFPVTELSIKNYKP